MISLWRKGRLYNPSEVGRFSGSGSNIDSRSEFTHLLNEEDYESILTMYLFQQTLPENVPLKSPEVAKLWTHSATETAHSLNYLNTPFPKRVTYVQNFMYEFYENEEGMNQ